MSYEPRRVPGVSTEARSDGAFAVHHLGVERLALAQVHVVLIGDLVRQQQRQILQRLGGHRRRHAAEERAQILVGLVLLAIQVHQPLDHGVHPVHGNLGHHLAEVRRAVAAQPPPTITKYCGIALPPTLRTLPWNPIDAT